MSLKNRIYVKPEKSRLINLLEDIKSGRIKIPVFQRDFVWKKNQRLELFDSLNNGFPIGSLLFWKPADLVFNFHEKIGPFGIENKSNNYSYVLDGFQRISTLFGSLINPNTYEEKIDFKILNDYLLYYDLKEEEFIQIRGKEEIYQIPLFKLIDTFEFLSYSDSLRNNIEDVELSSKYINRAKKLANQLLDYEIPFVEIIGGEIEDAVEIFHRVNSKGSDISPVWMLNALTYEENKFRFQDKISNLKERLEAFNFHEISTDIILHCIETSTGKIYFDVNLKNLAKNKDFPQLVENAFLNIEKAVEFLYTNVNVFDNKILPYNLQLIFITEFFRLCKKPTQAQLRELEKWFWITSYSNYFTIYSLSKQRKAFQQFQDFANGLTSSSVYYDDLNYRFKTLDFPDKILYGSVRSKCLGLFLIKNYLEYIPKNINTTNDLVFKDFEFKYLISKGKNAAMALPINKNSPLISTYKKTQNFQYFIDLNYDSAEYHKSFFIDNNLIKLFSNNKIDDAIWYRKKLIAKSESEFVEGLGIEYYGKENHELEKYHFENFDFENFDFQREIANSSIIRNLKNLHWDYDDKEILIETEESFNISIKNLNDLIEYLEDQIIQDVQGQIPLYLLDDDDAFLYYDDFVREYLFTNKLPELKKMGWNVEDL